MIKPLFRSECKIGLLIEEASCYGRGVLQGIAHFSKEHPSIHFHMEPANEHGLKDLLRWEPTALIAKTNEETLGNSLNGLQIPVVHVCSSSGKERLLVISDNFLVGELAARHLMQPGVKAYGYVGMTEGLYIQERYEGFASVLQKSGHPVSLFTGPFAELGSWIKVLDKPLALFTNNDKTGHFVLNKCKELKLSVPEDVMILGVDNNESISELIRPGLSSIELDTERIGQRATELAWKVLSGKVKKQVIRLAPRRLVPRGSTCLQALQDPLLSKIVADIQSTATKTQALKDIMKSSPLGRITIERRFRRLVGRTPLQEIRRVRINHAKKLLETTSLPLKAIAEECGYPTQTRLIESFIKQTGITPTDYRTCLKTEKTGTF